MTPTTLRGLYRASVADVRLIRRALCVLYANSTDPRERERARALLDKVDEAEEKHDGC